MSRAAFYDALANDDFLNSLGLIDDPDHPTILNNYSKEERPTHSTPFIILRWGPTPRPFTQDPDVPVKSPEQVTVWVHYPKGVSGDFNDVIKVLDQIDSIARGLRDVVGSDGYTLSFVVIGDRSGDLDDDGFQTITKWANYEIHSRKG